MGSAASSVRAISFPNPKNLSTNPPVFAESNDVWIYFPTVGYHSGFPYTNSARGWWMKFDGQQDIGSVRSNNGLVTINFRPGQASALNLPQNGGSVLMGTRYQVNQVGNHISLVIPYSNVILNE